MEKITITTKLLIVCLINTLSINAYENSFFNNTDEPIGIAIQFSGIDNSEPLYKKLIKPQEAYTFTPDKADIPQIKWGFCLANYIYYVENPTQEQKAHNFEKTIWKKVPITWTEVKSKTKKTSKNTVIKSTSTDAKSLCRDRHFDITRDKHGKVVISASLND